MVTPFSRRPGPGDESPQATQTIQVVTAGPDEGEYLLPATRRGVAAQAAAAFGLLTGLWVASPRCSSRCSTAAVSTPPRPT